MKEVIIKNGQSYKIIDDIVVFSSPIGITANVYDVETNQKFKTVTIPTPTNGLYLNNDNAPIIDGYDFVVMDGIRFTQEEISQKSSVDLWYVKNTVPDRNATYDSSLPKSLYGKTDVLINTFNMTYFGEYAETHSTNSIFYNCNNIRRFNTSNATSADYMFAKASKITTIPNLDLSKVKSMMVMFIRCSSLKSIPFPLDFTIVTNVMNMFLGCISLTELRFNPKQTKFAANLTFDLSETALLTDKEVRPFFESLPNLNNMPQNTFKTQTLKMSANTVISASVKSIAENKGWILNIPKKYTVRLMKPEDKIDQLTAEYNGTTYTAPCTFDVLENGPSVNFRNNINRDMETGDPGTVTVDVESYGANSTTTLKDLETSKVYQAPQKATVERGSAVKINTNNSGNDVFGNYDIE